MKFCRGKFELPFWKFAHGTSVNLSRMSRVENPRVPHQYLFCGNDISSRVGPEVIRSLWPKGHNTVRRGSLPTSIICIQGGNVKRYFEFRGEDETNKSGQSNKFWEIEVIDSILTIRYGKLGSNGQQNTKHFPDDESAQKAATKAIAEKMRKGYEEFDPSNGGNLIESIESTPDPTRSNLEGKRKGVLADEADSVHVVADDGPERAILGYCHECGEEIQYPSNFCWNCGSEIAVEPTVCPDCRTIRFEDDRFCSECGGEFELQGPSANQAEGEFNEYEDEPEDTSTGSEVLANWMRAQLVNFASSGKVIRLEFLAGSQPRFIFSIAKSQDGAEVDLCFSESEISLEEIFSSDYHDYSEADAEHPTKRRHFYWQRDDFAQLEAENLTSDIANQVGHGEWRAISHEKGLFKSKTRTEIWRGY